MTQLWKTSMERSEGGLFAKYQHGEKILRSMKLTDYCWNKLEQWGEEEGISRAEVVERLTRAEDNQQAIILKALEAFIEMKRESWGEKSSQKGKDFNLDTPRWQYLKEFKELIENSPWELGVGEE